MNEVVFIGTSDAFGAGGRRQSAILLRTGHGGVLIDCGMTTGTGMCDLGIDRGEIDTILVSHFHGDHFGGIPALLLAALYEDGRTAPLRIAGPPSIERRIYNLAATLGYGIEDREWTFPILFQEFAAGSEIEVGPLNVRAFETVHQPHTHPHGLVIRSAGLTVAYSGDTGWFESLPREVGEADLFISECTYVASDFEYHLNHEQLLERRDRFACARMVLTHLGSEMCELRGGSPFEIADDGLAIKL
jgi:ribonuclease BN (tRNA processing enzyme)